MAEEPRREGEEPPESAPGSGDEGAPAPAPAVDPPDVAPDEDAPGRAVPS
jgi:hypothetical protein